MYDTLSDRTLQLMKEVVERQKTEAKLRLAANAIENTLEAICITDADANVIDVNPAFYQTTQCSQDEVLGRNLKALKSGLEDEKLSCAIWEAVAEKGHWNGEIWNRTKSGEIDAEWLTLSAIKNEQGEVTNYVGVFSNVSHLIQQRHKLERIANHDALTGLPNRLLLADRMELAIAHAERTHGFLAVCYLDLDGFKPVNDRLGHAAGDQLLREIAQRLLKIMRGNDTVARLGGDEFVILFGDLKKPEDCTELLDRLLQEIERPVPIQNEFASVTGSIGVTIFPQDGGNPEALLRHADQAMYQAKQQGKSRYQIYVRANQAS
jgi:diguanylate cyclase (GGDEF)-like protein/PAS domain S-box-containing protein